MLLNIFLLLAILLGQLDDSKGGGNVRFMFLTLYVLFVGGNKGSTSEHTISVATCRGSQAYEPGNDDYEHEFYIDVPKGGCTVGDFKKLVQQEKGRVVTVVYKLVDEKRVKRDDGEHINGGEDQIIEIDVETITIELFGENHQGYKYRRTSE